MFSFDDYRKIISIMKERGDACGYEEALHRDRFVIMRHDVEYSVDRAYELSKAESEMDFVSTWFFQWTNNSYNILSRRSQAMINDMHARGHHIGLHFALNGLTDMKQVRRQIAKEMRILSDMFDFEITQFSVHRPSAAVLAENIKLPNILNAYQNEFFTFAPEITEETKLEVKYLSDANHIWRYGYPDRENILSHDKVQILTHPFAWCEKGYDNKNNYASLIKEKYAEMIESIDGECKDFGVYKDEFMSAQLIQEKE